MARRKTKPVGMGSAGRKIAGADPVLQLDDGSHLSESVAICRYLEGLHPEPNLFGRDLREQAEVERWNRRMELELFAAIARTAQNTSPIFQGRFKQFPEYGEEQRSAVYRRLERMDRELSGNQFVAGDASQSRTLRRWSQSTSVVFWQT